ncbi:MAG: lamin tail domain-containing protein [Salinivirgaceae bacterium]|nr:lamin tail domain-containing protein [Salinivirgaceae bacterium]
MNKKTALCLVCLALFLAFAHAQTFSPNLSNSKSSEQTLLFADEFENLDQWTNTSDWLADGGLLHHSSTPNVAATSTIAASVANCDFSAGTTIWRFALKTAGFTPTTANYFQFFLMTEKADLTNSQNSGYYVSTTTSNPKVLTLNKLEAGGKKSTLLKTDYVWTQDALICVEVIRAATGLWSISYGNSFNNLTTFASSTTDVTYSSSDSVGLLFTFIKGNVGKLWADSISVVYQPNPISVADFSFNGTDKITVSFSAEVDSASVCNTNNYMLQAGEVISVGYNSSQPKQVVLTVDELQVGSNNLTVSGVADVNGVEMTAAEQFDFEYWIAPQPGDVVVNEIFFDPTPVVALPEYDFFEIYNNRNYAISLNGWKVDVAGTQKELADVVIDANGYVIVTSSAATKEFAKYGTTVVGISTTSLTNTGRAIKLLSDKGAVIDSVSYTQSMIADTEKQAGGWSLERIDANNLCGGANNWAVSVADAGGTPGKQNSVKAKNIDNEQIVISSTHIANDKQIVLFLSELPDEQSVTFVANYQLDGKSPTSVSLNGLQLTLTFAQSFAVDTQLHLSVKDISDQCGNVIDDTTLTLVYHKVALYDLVITEIMATPEPTAGLPACEYVELYNRSNFDIETDSLSIKVGKTEAKLEHGVIGAHQYALVAKLSAVDSLAQFGNVIGSQKMPALPATGSISVLCQGNLVCYTNYSSSWYADELKKEGGFSLERISLLSADETGNNWAETIDVKGGTPCHPNSVAIDVADTIAPIALYAVPLSERKVRIVFNKMVIANDASLIEIQPTIGNMLSVVMAPDNYYAIDATLPVAINPNTDYSIIFSKQITDVFGNTIATDTLSLFMPMVAEVGDVVINEVLFNTKAGGCDFVELYNRSDHAVNIATFCLATRSAGAIKTPKHIEQPGYVLPAGGYVVLSTNSQLVMSQYATTDSLAFFNLAALPTYANDHGVVVLADTAGVVYDEFEYDKKMHFALLSSVEGVSLERIDPNKPTDNAANWHSAAEYTGGATPGYQNSCFAPIVSGNSTLSIENEAFSPDNDGFDDQLNICYQFENPGNVASVSIFNAKGVRVRKLVSNEQLGTSGFWSWDGLDDNGNRVPIGVYVVYCELFSTDGESKQIKKPCVVSARMD